MLTIEPFRVEHATEIEPQAAQAIERPADMGPYAEAGNCYTARWRGRIVVIGGVVDTDIGPFLWACVARGAPMVVVDRCVRRFIGTLSGLRLTAAVNPAFGPGVRWLKSLGFNCVGWIDDDLRFVREAA